MKAITLWQPYASLIPLGFKTIETRSWSTNYRGPLAIHASKSVGASLIRGASLPIGDFTIHRDDQRGSDPSYLLRGPIDWPYRMPLGAVVATCELVDVLPMVGIASDLSPHLLVHGRDGEMFVWDGGSGFSVEEDRPYGDYRPGRFAWILRDVQRVPEIPAVGHQGLWEWDGISKAAAA